MPLQLFDQVVGLVQECGMIARKTNRVVVWQSDAGSAARKRPAASKL